MRYKFDILILVIIFLLGFYLRTFYLQSDLITFGYDQARDAYESIGILHGDLKIQGPPASAPGLFHGVLYYYLLAPAYFIGAGDPVVANIWLSIINLLTIIPIFLLARLLFNKYVGMIAAVLFAISLDAVQYANWMSNPSPAVLFSALFYLGLGLYLFNKKFNKNISLIIASLGLGLSTQSEIFLGYLFLPLFISLVVFKTRPTVREVLLFLIVYGFTTFSMIFSYYKFGFTLSGLASTIGSTNDPASSWKNFTPAIELYLNRFAEYFYRTFLPTNIIIAGISGLLMVYLSFIQIRNKNKYSSSLIFLLIMIFSHAFLIALGGHYSPFINVGLQSILVIFVSYFTFLLIRWNRILGLILLILIIMINIDANIKYNKGGQIIFSIQKSMLLSYEKDVLDYTYTESDGKPFSINTLTSPLWINTTWSYIYEWYGKNKYGYIPSFHGRDQSGYLGKLPPSQRTEKVYFLILEPIAGIPMWAYDGTIGQENTQTKVIEEKYFGEILVQKRVMINQ